MATSVKQPAPAPLDSLLQKHYLFRGLDQQWLMEVFQSAELVPEKLYSSRPVYTASFPDTSLSFLYLITYGGPVIVRSTPLDRVLAISYPGGCFGMQDLPLGYGRVARGFPSQVEAYKTTEVIKLPLEILQALYQDNAEFRDRYDHLFELQEKFCYHLLNCSASPPQAVAALLRALIYQERALGNQPDDDGIYTFDLPTDVIARASQLNHRTVEQVLKGMQQVGLLDTHKSADASGDIIRAIDPEGLKEIYSTTRDKISWWPLK
jgi:hypothetical protein